ncbi:MAG: delta-60 repeat domain-containing protein [Solirubrobacteraceae bacterium]
MRHSLLVLVALALVAALAPAGAAAKPQTGVRPDPSFGNGLGYVTLSLSGQSTFALAATPTSDGIVVAGQAVPSTGTPQVLVAKFDSSGKLDPNFGTQGIFISSLPDADGPFGANAIAQDARGRLVVAGGYGQNSVLVMRLTATGQLDTTFGTGGLMTIPVGGVANSMALQKDGRILVGGVNGTPDGKPMVVARLTPNGAVDPSFGTNGKTQILFWDPIRIAGAGLTGLATTPNGQIVGSGHLDHIGAHGEGTAGVFRLTSSGHLDPGYGNGGGLDVEFTNPDGSLASWYASAMTLSPNGRATVTGDGLFGPGNAILTARLTAAGAPDPSFGPAGDGRVVIPGASDDSDTTGGAAELGGVFTLGVGSSFAQLLPDGTPNENFAPGGITNIGVPPQVDLNATVVPRPHIAVLAGFVENVGNLYVSRWRLPPSRGAGQQRTQAP